MPEHRWSRALMAIVAIACACATSAEDGDGETHWLKRCESSAECGQSGECLCGMCTSPCDAAGSCSTGPAGSVCAASPGVSSCLGVAAPDMICVAPCDASLGCAPGFSCSGGSCVPSTDELPEGGAAEGGAAGDRCRIGAAGTCEGIPPRAPGSGFAPGCCSFGGRAYDAEAACVLETYVVIGCYEDPTGQCEVDAGIGCLERSSEAGVEVFQSGSTYELLGADLAAVGLRYCSNGLADSVPNAPFCPP